MRTSNRSTPGECPLAMKACEVQAEVSVSLPTTTVTLQERRHPPRSSDHPPRLCARNHRVSPPARPVLLPRRLRRRYRSRAVRTKRPRDGLLARHPRRAWLPRPPRSASPRRQRSRVSDEHRTGQDARRAPVRPRGLPLCHGPAPQERRRHRTCRRAHDQG